MRRSAKGLRGITSVLLLSTALVFALTGCGTLTRLLKSEAADDSLTVPATPTDPTAAATAPTAETTAPPPVEPATASTIAETIAAEPDVSPTLTPERESVPASSQLDESNVSALVQIGSDADTLEEDYDPWETFNEKMFNFNRNLDRYVLKPVARGYRFVMPDPWQVLISNGFSNINFVPRFVNSLLQAKWGGAGRELSRFLINSTAGIGGLFDPARDYWGIEKSREDFGQTLCTWGSGTGPYLVLPLLEPLTVRDGIGKAVDGAMDPLSYVLPFFWDRLGMKIGDTVNDRALNYDLFQGFEESVIDMYSAVRHAYLQRRAQLCKE